MFGRMMNNYYYGKSGKGDFRKDDMPETRMALFWDTLRTRLSSLCRLNLIYMVAWIPAMIVILLSFSKVYSNLTAFMMVQEYDYATYTEKITEANGEVGLTEEEYNTLKNSPVDMRAYLDNSILKMLLWLFPCIAFTGPVTAGLSFVTRNWARDEHAFIWSDFRDAVKANWKYPLVLSTITGALPGLCYLGWITYGDMAAQNAIMIVPQILLLLVGVVWAISITYMHPLTVTYDLKLKGVIRNGLLIGIARLPFSVGIRLLHCVPVLIAFAVIWFFGVDPMLGLVLLGCYYVLIGFSLSRFVTASYTNAVFDRFINARIEGAKVNQGLREKDEFDDEEEETENQGETEE